MGNEIAVVVVGDGVVGNVGAYCCDDCYNDNFVAVDYVFDDAEIRAKLDECCATFWSDPKRQ